MGFGSPTKDTIKDPRAALAEWIWRKCRNHDPLRKRFNEKDHPLSAGRLEHVPDTNETFYVAGGKRFKITVEEVGVGISDDDQAVPMVSE